MPTMAKQRETALWRLKDSAYTQHCNPIGYHLPSWYCSAQSRSPITIIKHCLSTVSKSFGQNLFQQFPAPAQGFESELIFLPAPVVPNVGQTRRMIQLPKLFVSLTICPSADQHPVYSLCVPQALISCLLGL